jgi:hypothetical protein
MNRNFLLLSVLCLASLASAATPSPTPKPVAPKSSAPAAMSATAQNSGNAAQPSGETKVLRTYKGPGYFDAALALKFRDAFSAKPWSPAPAAAAISSAPQRGIVANTSLASQNR